MFTRFFLKGWLKRADNPGMNWVSLLAYFGLALAALGVLAFAWNVGHAPEGYEDDTGFHLGQEPLAVAGFRSGEASQTEITSYGSREEKAVCGPLVRAA